MNRSRPKQIVIRASDEEFDKIKSNVKKSKLKQNEYMLKCCLDKEINVVEGMHEVTVELKRIGNNLNQLTREVHQGRANCKNELGEIQKELGETWQLLRLLIQKER